MSYDLFNEKIGVCSLKIEGRMKSKEYVYTTISQIKKTLSDVPTSQEEKEKMMVSFNRGYTLGHTYRNKEYELMNVKTSNHQGIDIGKVIGIEKNKLKIKVDKDLYQNDGIRFVGKDKSEGCRLNFLYDRNHKLTNKLCAHSIGYVDRIQGIKVNDQIKKTVDSQLEKEVDTSIRNTNRQVGVLATVTCQGIGYPLELTITEGKVSVTVISDALAQVAKNHPTDEKTISKQLKKTKDTYVYFESIDYNLQGNIFFTISDMNQLRKKGIEAFYKKKLEKDPIVELTYAYSSQKVDAPSSVLEIETVNQIVPFHGDIISESVEGVLSKGNITQTKGYYLGHLGNGAHLDVNLNVTNSYAIACVLEMGYSSMVISDELSLNQCILMLDAFKNRYHFDAPVCRCVYQKRRFMTMNYCPVHMLTNKKNCRECHENRYELVSKDLKRLLCIGDRQCHMRLFDVEAWNRMHEINVLKEHGMKSFKLIMVDESNEDVKYIVEEFNRFV